MDLAAFLPGRWTVTRRVMGSERARFDGAATFRWDGGTLLHEERGTLRAQGTAMEATRTLRWHLEGPRPRVTFADGRPFHEIAPDGAARHWCDPDLYEGRYRWGAARWSLAWRVTGPRKRLVIVSRMTRA